MNRHQTPGESANGRIAVRRIHVVHALSCCCNEHDASEGEGQRPAGLQAVIPRNGKRGDRPDDDQRLWTTTMEAQPGHAGVRQQQDGHATQCTQGRHPRRASGGDERETSQQETKVPEREHF